LAGGACMLSDSVQCYLTLRRSAGFSLKEVGLHLRSFAAYSDRRGYQHISAHAVIKWAEQVPSLVQRARRLGDVARFARYLKAEDPRHVGLPPWVRQTVKTQLAVRCKFLDRQDHFNAF